MGGNDGAASNKGDKTNPFNEGNMMFPTSMDELPDELRQKLQAKLDADVKAFLESCTKNQHDKVTQFQEPSYGDATASASSGTKENGAGKAKYDEEVNTDTYPTHANFAQMLVDERKLHLNNLQHLSNLLNVRMDKYEGNTTDCDQSGAV
jgi:Fe-S cluster biosynthesis and repair protein YggX